MTELTHIQSATLGNQSSQGLPSVYLAQRLAAKRMLAELAAKGAEQASKNVQSKTASAPTSAELIAPDAESTLNKVLAQQQAGVAAALFGQKLNRRQIAALFKKLVVDDESVLHYTLSRILSRSDLTDRDQSDAYQDESEGQRTTRYLLAELYALQSHDEGKLELDQELIEALESSSRARVANTPVEIQAQVTAGLMSDQVASLLNISPKNFAAIYSKLLVDSNRIGALADQVIKIDPKRVDQSIYLLIGMLQNAFRRDRKLSRHFSNPELTNQFLSQLSILADLGRLHASVKSTKAMLRKHGAERLPEDSHELSAACRLIDHEDSVAASPIKDYARGIPKPKFRSVYLAQMIKNLRSVAPHRWKDSAVRLQVLTELMNLSQRAYAMSGNF